MSAYQDLGATLNTVLVDGQLGQLRARPTIATGDHLSHSQLEETSKQLQE